MKSSKKEIKTKSAKKVSKKSNIDMKMILKYLLNKNAEIVPEDNKIEDQILYVGVSTCFDDKVMKSHKQYIISYVIKNLVTGQEKAQEQILMFALLKFISINHSKLDRLCILKYLNVQKDPNAALNDLIHQYHLDVNAVNQSKNTVLHYASFNGVKESIVYALIRCKADVNVRNIEQYTPLELAVSQGRADLGLIKLLIENKADPYALDEEGMSLRECISNETKPDVVKYVEHILSLESDKIQKNLLKLALSESFDINSPRLERQYILQHVIKANNPLTELNKLMLHYSLDLNIQGNNGFTILDCAGLIGANILVFKALIECKVDVNARNVWKWTPLELAVYQGKADLSVIKLLIENKADPYAIDEEGNRLRKCINDKTKPDVAEYIEYILDSESKPKTSMVDKISSGFISI